MQKKTDKWMELCELAAKEQNPQKLMELTGEIIRLLDEQKQRPSGRANLNVADSKRENHGGTPEENQAIEDALSGVSVLRTEVAAWQSKRAS